MLLNGGGGVDLMVHVPTQARGGGWGACSSLLFVCSEINSDAL